MTRNYKEPTITKDYQICQGPLGILEELRILGSRGPQALGQVPPSKRPGPLASGAARLAWLRLAWLRLLAWLGLAVLGYCWLIVVYLAYGCVGLLIGLSLLAYFTIFDCSSLTRNSLTSFLGISNFIYIVQCIFSIFYSRSSPTLTPGDLIVGIRNRFSNC